MRNPLPSSGAKYTHETDAVLMHLLKLRLPDSVSIAEHLDRVEHIDAFRMKVTSTYQGGQMPK